MWAPGHRNARAVIEIRHSMTIPGGVTDDLAAASEATARLHDMVHVSES